MSTGNDSEPTTPLPPAAKGTPLPWQPPSHTETTWQPDVAAMGPPPQREPPIWQQREPAVDDVPNHEAAAMLGGSVVEVGARSRKRQNAVVGGVALLAAGATATVVVALTSGSDGTPVAAPTGDTKATNQSTGTLGAAEPGPDTSAITSTSPSVAPATTPAAPVSPAAPAQKGNGTRPASTKEAAPPAVEKGQQPLTMPNGTYLGVKDGALVAYASNKGKLIAGVYALPALQWSDECTCDVPREAGSYYPITDPAKMREFKSVDPRTVKDPNRWLRPWRLKETDYTTDDGFAGEPFTVRATDTEVTVSFSRSGRVERLDLSQDTDLTIGQARGPSVGDR